MSNSKEKIEYPVLRDEFPLSCKRLTGGILRYRRHKFGKDISWLCVNPQGEKSKLMMGAVRNFLDRPDVDTMLQQKRPMVLSITVTTEHNTGKQKYFRANKYNRSDGVASAIILFVMYAILNRDKTFYAAKSFVEIRAKREIGWVNTIAIQLEYATEGTLPHERVTAEDVEALRVGAL